MDELAEAAESIAATTDRDDVRALAQIVRDLVEQVQKQHGDLRELERARELDRQRRD